MLKEALRLVINIYNNQFYLIQYILFLLFFYLQQVKVPSLERYRIDTTIYQRSFEKLHGLARLLILERLNTSDDNPIKSKNRNTFQKKSGTYSSRVWENFELKNNKFEISDYESTTLPYGPEFNVKAIMNLIYKKVCIVFQGFNFLFIRKN